MFSPKTKRYSLIVLLITFVVNMSPITDGFNHIKASILEALSLEDSPVLEAGFEKDGKIETYTINKHEKMNKQQLEYLIDRYSKVDGFQYVTFAPKVDESLLHQAATEPEPVVVEPIVVKPLELIESIKPVVPTVIEEVEEEPQVVEVEQEPEEVIVLVEEEAKEVVEEAEEPVEAPKKTNGIRVGVFDSGITLNHEAFETSIVHEGWNSLVGSTNVTDDIGHGTHIAGIIAEYAPGTEIIPYKIVSEEGGKLSDLVRALEKAIAEDDLDIINMSFGFPSSSAALESALRRARSQGIIVVAAAGNKANTSAYYPAFLDGVIAVGAATYKGATYSNSNYGSWVDIAAPGHYVRSAKVDGSYGYRSGTSQAAAIVSARIAYYLATGQLQSSASIDQLVQVLDDEGATVRSGKLQGLTFVK